MPKVKSVYIIIAAALAAIYVAHTLSLVFTQDDAFISYRYVKNCLGGVGLVFNPGENVEGYTNFLFVIIMVLFGKMGINYIIVSKLIGVLSGISIIFLLIVWFEKYSDRKGFNLPAYGAPILLVANSAFAYWSISGLETVLFAALVFWGIYFASEKNLLFIPMLVLSALTRPEGTMIFGLILIYYWVVRAYKFRTILKLTAVYAVLIAPQFIFRLAYYGDLLPNPFYAKTGWSAEYFLSGLSYIWLFLKQYGFAGILIAVPIAAVGRMNRKMRLPLFITAVYFVYILMVGGDVLHGHRFFMVLLPLLYLMFFAGIDSWLSKTAIGRTGAVYTITVLIILATAGLTYGIPYKWIRSVRRTEIGLVDGMKFQSNIIRQARGSDYTIAMSTIGAFGYYSDARVIDLLGLTDRVIAKNPKPVEGIESTWKERNYNIPYLMKRNPDLILFSTGMKPSAPAEKALFLSSKFRKGYYPVFHIAQYMWTIYKRNPGYDKPDKYFPNPQFINLFTQALNYNRDEKLDLAMEYALQSERCSPPDFYLPLALMGEIELKKGNLESGIEYLQRAFELSDGYAIIAGDKLGRYYQMIGDSARGQKYLDIAGQRNTLF